MGRPLVFVSNFDLSNRKGGFDGLGGKIYDDLSQKLHHINLLDKVNPPVSVLDKVISKLFRITGIPAKFPLFSPSRLDIINQQLKDIIKSVSGDIFFHGVTPWVNYKPQHKYYAFTDCSFETYINKYHKRSLFSNDDINRIIESEKIYMGNATGIFFSSQWALEETKRAYNLSGKNFKNINQGPLLDIPVFNEHAETTENQFLFIGLDFYGKGGDVICEAFQDFIVNHKNYKLLIVGQKPPDKYLEFKNIEYLGYINKSNAIEKNKLKVLYQKSKAILLFTQKDIAPVVLIEAGLYGCAGIANDHCAIPEMIVDGKTGYLIHKSKKELRDAMERIAGLEQQELLDLRKSVREYYQNKYSWENSINSILAVING